MRALGRVVDVVFNPSGVDICLKDVSGIAYAVVSGSTATTLTFVAKPSFGGSSTTWTPANGFGQTNAVFTRTANTAAWVQNTASWASNALTMPAANTQFNYVDILVSQLADTFDYINATVAGTGATCPMAILYDLTVQRKPQNLRIPSA